MHPPRSRVTIRRMMAAIAVVGIVLAITKSLFIDNRPRDMLIAAISALEGHFTVYAQGYSESKFRSLRVGMTVRQVEDIMGPPLATGQWVVPGGDGTAATAGGLLDDIWYYTHAGKARGNYWRREICFRNGLVHSTHGTYYLD